MSMIKGSKLTKEHKMKLSQAKSGKYLGKNNPFFGKKHSQKSKDKMSKTSKKNHPKYWLGKIRPRGENNPKWKGGYENKLAHNRRRLAIKRGASGSHTLYDWELLKKQYNYVCPCCNKSEPKIILTEDHIIPLSKGGSDNIENIQPLCKKCNSIKHDKIIKYD